MWFSMVAIVVVFGSLLGIVVIQTFIVQNRVEWDSVNSELVEAREQNQRLRLQVIELEAPERILETAITRLGMVRPDERTYVPGVDPDLVEVRLPPPGDPFGPAPLPQFLRAGGS
ncbi:MAG: cell division protein FtsL [Acidimicrobiia bacterium]|nr:cell division protein FtsL [Acidimicrobiia bacterium]